MWYLWLLPLVLSALNLSSKRGLAVLVAWIGGQAAWLSMAYRLEFLGEAVFKELWTAGVGFFIVNVGVVWILIGQLES
jgi:phosphatidylinositol glycan class M